MALGRDVKILYIIRKFKTTTIYQNNTLIVVQVKIIFSYLPLINNHILWVKNWKIKL